MLQGVTKRYMGPPQHDLWKPRVGNKHIDMFSTAMIAQEVNVPIVQSRQQLSKVSVTRITSGDFSRPAIRDTPPDAREVINIYDSEEEEDDTSGDVVILSSLIGIDALSD
ncbi:hypothetical protein COCC4DRAFT_69339 [Bipolaris maydis ATCC 48331]|uniref:Uncharacterized protein n=2 Tax=Cochliobolus heterostrophus TaxID=5016 RepID=M2T1Q4_COCH5|nr:uncharacterized protein COCC4DRAFT_69339 [Bipolaris maydis ATCC 48331]EMD91540.1 hypothetical protein COCHEDRAFT_1213975 [Bipolaris maydis C5]KAJ5027290.1 hypothetical protein J3E73DRAFT_369078 [Bipolaris maydis]ENI08703.1 hypothetical protein COCC4DRAFT_69339 [Bipolaris maydis ATCC 48331]KAJ6270813.1 hypothetical protein PSV08DRAFT_351631 [Bipolaris maydis]KAJ6278163.1 hypothetical protein J3E71DRAFT_346383 [Bipolaris maydis]